MWENIKLRGLVPAYHNKKLLFGKWVWIFFALPLLSNHKIEEGFVFLKSSRPQVRHDGVPLNTQVISFVAYYERFWMGEMMDKMCVWGSVHRTNNGAESFHASLNRELRPKSGFWAFLKKMDEKISRTLTDLERLKNGVTVTRPNTVSETQRRIAEASTKLEAGQLTVEEFINKMKYVGWKGIKEKQGNNVHAEDDFADVDHDVDLQDINVDLLDVSLQDINAGHHLQGMFADSPPRTMQTYNLPRTRFASTTGSSTARATSSQPTALTLANYTLSRERSASSQQPSGTDRPPRRGRAARSAATGSPYRPQVTRSAARTETSLRIQADQEVVAQEEDAPVVAAQEVAAQEVAGQEAAAKKNFKSCAVCLHENISVTRPIYLVPCGHGDICKECAQKDSTKNCHLCRSEIFTFVQAIVSD